MRGSNRGFTLVELLAAIAIIASLLVVAGIYIGGYIGEARQRADARTLEVLNDAITRYKTQGGGTSGFTAGAPIANILNRLQQPINWNGLNHQVMKTGVTYPAASLQATGTGSGYKFTRYNSYPPSGTGSESEEDPMPYGEGVGYIAVGGPNATMGIFMTAITTTGFWALKIGNGSPTIYTSDPWALGVGGGEAGTFWACADESDSTPAGHIIEVNCEGAEYGNQNVSALNTSGLTDMTVLRSRYNPQLTTISLSGCASLIELHCANSSLSALTLTGCTSLQYIYCNNNQLTTLDFSGNTSLIDIDCSFNQLTSLNLSGLGVLWSLSCQNNQLTTIDLSDCTALQGLYCQDNQLTSILLPDPLSEGLELGIYGNTGLIGSALAIDSFYAALPSSEGTSFLYIGVGTSEEANDSIATGKGWQIFRTEL